MFGKSLRGLAAAFLIGTATVAVSALAFTSAAEAGVRPAVGKPLQEAISLAKEGKGSAALAKVHQAEGVPNLTADEHRVIDQTKQFVEVKTGAGGGALGAKAKFANDYNARRYQDVVGPDAEALRKAGGLDENSRLIIAQAYYLMGDYQAALRELNGLGNSETALSLKMAVAHKAGDAVAEMAAARALVLSGKPQYWTYLLSAADQSGNLSDPDTLAVFRIRFLTGNMRGADDYSTATQIAIQLGFPQEGLSIEKKGFDLKVLSDARQQRLLALAQKDAALQAGQMAQIEKAAHAAPAGDDLVHLAEIYWGIGRYQDALKAADEGLEKGRLKDPAQADMAKGMALVGLKRGSEASKSFKKAEGEAKNKTVADLWDVYARSH